MLSFFRLFTVFTCIICVYFCLKRKLQVLVVFMVERVLTRLTNPFHNPEFILMATICKALIKVFQEQNDENAHFDQMLISGLIVFNSFVVQLVFCISMISGLQLWKYVKPP